MLFMFSMGKPLLICYHTGDCVVNISYMRSLFGNTFMLLRAGTFRMLTRQHSTILSLSAFRVRLIPYRDAAAHSHLIDSPIYIKSRERFSLQLNNKIKEV